MSNLSNKVLLIGNVGETPKITNLESGHKVTRFSIATNAYYRNTQGETVKDTQWHSIVAWNKKADIIENYVTKGKQIAIEGKLISRSYVNDKNLTCYVTEIVANDILLLGAKDTETISNEKEEPKKSQTRSRSQKPKKETKNTAS